MFSSKMYIYTNNTSKVIFALTKLLMTDEVTRIDVTLMVARIVCSQLETGTKKPRILAEVGTRCLKNI